MNVSKSKACSLWREKLSATCLDELSPDEWATFKAHAASCELCNAVLADYTEVDSRIHQALIPRQPLGLWKAFLNLPPYSNTIDASSEQQKTNPANSRASSTICETYDKTI